MAFKFKSVVGFDRSVAKCLILQQRHFSGVKRGTLIFWDFIGEYSDGMCRQVLITTLFTMVFGGYREER